jgi:hypothetical protein
MSHQNKTLSKLLEALDLGASVAEADTLLETARVETSAFSDLLNDRVDLVLEPRGPARVHFSEFLSIFCPTFC